MSRVAKQPVVLPKGVECTVSDGSIAIKGPKGSLSMALPAGVEVTLEQGEVRLGAAPERIRFAGTVRALVANMVTGVSAGFERKLELVGVGYRAAVQGDKLNLSLGFAHPVVYAAPAGVTIETPSQNEILIKGADKQRVGEAAATIRGFRPPEPYKGKGVRYAGERIHMKEAKKA